jgi:hypothetical protein
MKDRRPNGAKRDGSTSYSSDVPTKRGWNWKEQEDTMLELRQIRFKGKPQHKRK